MIAIGSAWVIQADILLPMTPTSGDWATLFRGTGSGSHHVIIYYLDAVTIGMYDNEFGTGWQTTNVKLTSFTAGWHTLTVRGFGGYQQFSMDGVLFGTVAKQVCCAAQLSLAIAITDTAHAHRRTCSLTVRLRP